MNKSEILDPCSTLGNVAAVRVHTVLSGKSQVKAVKLCGVLNKGGSQPRHTTAECRILRGATETSIVTELEVVLWKWLRELLLCHSEKKQ